MLKRIFSLVLVLILLLSSPLAINLPFGPVITQAIELEAGEFNPVTGEVEINFKIQFTQEVSIEIFVNDEHFGWLIKNMELAGYDGALMPHDPCASYTIPPASAQSHSAGIAGGDEVRIEEDKDDSGTPKGAGYYKIHWSGSINGNPVVSAAPALDQYKLKVSIKPQGYPARGKTPCSDPEEDVHDGEDWLWPQQYMCNAHRCTGRMFLHAKCRRYDKLPFAEL